MAKDRGSSSSGRNFLRNYQTLIKKAWVAKLSFHDLAALKGRRLRTLTRQELYDQVWDEPVARVAERYQLSGAGLRKLCLRYDIPVPPRGYWARLAAGQKVKPTRLPKPAMADRTVYVQGNAGGRTGKAPAAGKREAPKHPASEVLAARKAFEADPANRIAVTDSPASYHPWARGLKRRLLSSGPNHLGLHEADIAEGLIRVAISRPLVARAVAILNALGRAVKRRGFEVLPGKPDRQFVSRIRHGPRLLAEGERFRLSLREHVRREEKKPRSKRPAPVPGMPWLDPGREYEHHPSGRLKLRVMSGDCSYGDPQLTIWDASDKPLEERLNELMVAFAELAVAQARCREVRAEEAKRRREEQERLEELRRQREAEELERAQESARAKELEELADNWSRARLLREFIVAAEKAGKIPGPRGAPAELEEWLTWARAVASSLDPLG